jgi:hypothetical protein
MPPQARFSIGKQRMIRLRAIQFKALESVQE